MHLGPAAPSWPSNARLHKSREVREERDILKRAEPSSLYGDPAKPEKVQGTNCNTQRVLQFGVIALGVNDVRRAAEFWCQALGYMRREDGFGGWSMVLTPPTGDGPKIALQRSETTPEDHPRIHFDLHVADAAQQTTEVARLEALGAKRVEWDSYPEDPDFVVLADPDGNRFCVVDLGHKPRLT
jgi:catechol 2,3-dioxygenase-like lactoylglutathione lyase family enzyme